MKPTTILALAAGLLAVSAAPAAAHCHGMRGEALLASPCAAPIKIFVDEGWNNPNVAKMVSAWSQDEQADEFIDYLGNKVKGVANIRDLFTNGPLYKTVLGNKLRYRLVKASARAREVHTKPDLVLLEWDAYIKDTGPFGWHHVSAVAKNLGSAKDEKWRFQSVLVTAVPPMPWAESE